MFNSLDDDLDGEIGGFMTVTLVMKISFDLTLGSSLTIGIFISLRELGAEEEETETERVGEEEVELVFM